MTFFWAILHLLKLKHQILKEMGKIIRMLLNNSAIQQLWLVVLLGLTDGFVCTITIKCIGTGEELLRVQLIINNIIPFKHEAWGETQ
jgi:hypothetical protein